MNTITIIGQTVGVFAAAVMIFSFQFRDNKKLFAAQVCSTFLFTIHYLLLGLGGDSGAYAGMAQNFGGVLFRILLVLAEKNKKFKHPLALTVICAYAAVTSAVTFDPSNVIGLLPMVGNMVGMGALWSGDPNVIRVEQFSFTSPCWLIYNIFTGSIAGIFTESFNIISIAVYYIRALIRKKKTEKEERGTPDEESENNGNRQL